MLCGFATAYAGFGDLFLIVGDATRAYAAFFLNLVFTSFVATPHCLDKAVALSGKLGLDLVHRGATVGAIFAVGKSLVVYKHKKRCASCTAFFAF